MVEHLEYTNIREVLSRLTRHPLLVDTTLEEAVQYTMEFIGRIGVPNIYLDKLCTVEIEDYRGMLPCDLVQILQVKNLRTKFCLRYNTDSFMNDTESHDRNDDTFKVQGRIIYVTFDSGEIELAYKAVAVDKDGLPLLPNIEKFIHALEEFIKLKKFTILFDMGKISQQAFQNTQQEYCFAVGQCNSAFTIPSVSEMESITNMWNQLIVRENEFKTGFKYLGTKEYLKNH